MSITVVYNFLFKFFLNFSLNLGDSNSAHAPMAGSRRILLASEDQGKCI